VQPERDHPPAPSVEETKRPKRWIVLLNRASVAVALVLFAWFLVGQRAHAIRLWSDANPALLLASIGVFTLFVLAQTRVSVAVLHTLGAVVPPTAAMRAFLVSLLGRYLPGKIWIVTMRSSFLHERGVPVRIVLAAVLVENFYLFMTSTALFAVGREPTTPTTTALLFGSAALILAAAATLPRQILPSVIRLLARFGLESFRVRLNARHALAITGCYLGTWLLLGLGIWLLGKGLAFPFSSGHVITLAGAYGVAVVAGFAALFVPAGLGVREGVFALAMSGLLPTTEALFLAVGVRLAVSIAEILAAAITHLPFNRPNARRET
jgi:hypothetical protein